MNTLINYNYTCYPFLQKVVIVDSRYLLIFFLQFIPLDTSQLNRDNGVLFSEDLNDDYEVWTLQCPDDVSNY